MTSEQRPGERKGVSHAGIWGTDITGRRNSKDIKQLEAGKVTEMQQGLLMEGLVDFFFWYH